MTDTLTTERVRDLYTCATAWHADTPRHQKMREHNSAEFDQWLTAHDRETRAEAAELIADEVSAEIVVDLLVAAREDGYYDAISGTLKHHLHGWAEKFRNGAN